MGFSNEPLRLKLKEKNKKAVKISLLVDPSDVSKTRGILNYDKNKVNIKNRKTMENFSVQLASQQIDEIIDNDGIKNTSNIVKNESINNNKCFNLGQFVFGAATGAMTGTPQGILMGALKPYATCVAQKIFKKIFT